MLANAVEVLGLAEMRQNLSRTIGYQISGIFSGETGKMCGRKSDNRLYVKSCLRVCLPGIFAINP